MALVSYEFHTPQDYRRVNDHHCYTLFLKTDHPIYEGHFPKNPILPGVCFIQIVAELAELSLIESLCLTQLKTAKFPSPLNPNQTPKIDLTLICTPKTPGQWTIKATATDFKNVFLKFEGFFVEQKAV